MAAASPRLPSAQRRGATPPPRQAPSSDARAGNLRPSVAAQTAPTPSGASVTPIEQARRFAGLQNRPVPDQTGASNQSTPPARRTPRPGAVKQLHPLGNFIAQQQHDDFDGNGDGGEEGDTNDAYSGMSDSSDPGDQPSVLDASDQGFSPYASAANDNDQTNEAANDNDASPVEQTKLRNERSQQDQSRAQTTRNQLIPQNDPSASGEPGSTSQQRSNAPAPSPETSNTRSRVADRIKSLYGGAANQPKVAQALSSFTNPQTMREIENEAKQMVQRVRRVTTFFTFTEMIESLLEQNFWVAYRIFKPRSPESLQRNPLLEKIDRSDQFIAIAMNLTMGFLIFLVIAAIAVLVYLVQEYIAAPGAELLFQLAN